MNKLFVFALFAAVACVAVVANSDDAEAQILSLESSIDAQGNYNYNYATSNNIQVEEKGVGGHSAEGAYSFDTPEGEHVNVAYVADENGFQPTGSHIAPIPDAILRALEYVRTHPQYIEKEH